MSKNKSKELDVDFIGGQGPLTKEEEKQISEYIRRQKLLRAKRQHSRKLGTGSAKKGLPQRTRKPDEQGKVVA
ncbi:MAG: hypothetical protein HZB42_00210 [Sphingobacteriales bacterium]|nr:hypothetical protein [Sphingobacteriales bacterium]